MRLFSELEKVFGKPRWWKGSFKSLFLLNLSLYYLILSVLYFFGLINLYVFIDLIISPHLILIFIYYLLASESALVRKLYWVIIGTGIIGAPLFFIIPIIAITINPILKGSTSLLILTIATVFTVGPIGGYIIGKTRDFKKIRDAYNRG